MRILDKVSYQLLSLSLIYVPFDLSVRSNNVVQMFLFSCDHREKEETDSSPEPIRTPPSEMQTWETSRWFCTQVCFLPLANYELRYQDSRTSRNPSQMDGDYTLGCFNGVMAGMVSNSFWWHDGTQPWQRLLNLVSGYFFSSLFCAARKGIVCPESHRGCSNWRRCRGTVPSCKFEWWELPFL